MTIALPSYARPIMGSASDTPKPTVDRYETDRGPAQQRLANQTLLYNMALEFLFETQADCDSFISWYENDIGVIGWFTMRHPRTGATITARFPKGELGDIVPQVGGYAMVTISTTVEYFNV